MSDSRTAAPDARAGRDLEVVSPDRRPAAWVVAGAAPLVLVTAICLTTFRDYGATWDEDSQASYAAQLARWYETLGRDDVATRGELVRNYGGLFEVVAYQFSQRLPFGKFESRHLAGALFGVLGLFFAFRLGTLVGGPPAGVVAASFLALTPVYYGHMFANPKDIPFAALYLGALDAICRAARRWPAVSGWRVAGVGVAIGACMAVRVGGVVLLGVLAAAVTLAEARRRAGGAPAPPVSGGPRWRAAGRLLGTSACVAWFVMCAFWPYAWVSPLVHPARALLEFSHYPWGGRVLFDGALVAATEVPRSYLPTWLAISLPDFLLVAAGLGIGGLFLRRAAAAGWRRDGWLLALVALAGLGPLAVPIALRSTLYDGLRHVLFCVPPLVVVAAALLTDLLGRVRRPLAAALALPVMSGMVVTAVDMVQLHPYQYVYFNRIVGGGLAGAHQRFDTDYWCASIREAVAWTVREAPADASRPARVASGCPLFLVEYYLGRDARAAGRFVAVEGAGLRGGGVDLFLTVTRERKHESVPGTVLHRVERQGAPLCYVIAPRSAPVASGGDASGRR